VSNSDLAQLPTPKGLKAGALGLVSSVVIGVASTAPAYSLAATLGFIVAFVGLQSPVVVIIAFVPMLFTAIGYQELNKADPDCGTTFTWATRAFNPTTGWLGGWGILAADILVMASLAQVAGQYVFLLFNADGIGADATSGWVFLVGVLWIALMTYICYVGIELSARLQRVLLTIELIVLLIFAAWALIQVYGNSPSGSLHLALSWFNPFNIDSISSFVRGMLLMLFIYWGWDSAVSVNEETADPSRTPGRAAIISTVVLLITYTLVTVAAQAFAGVGDTGNGLNNSDNWGDVLSVLGKAVFGSSGLGSFMSHLLILMVLTSAAASTQTTILPTARPSLSMAVYRALPRVFSKIHPRHLTPSVSTITFGAVSIAFYAVLNFLTTNTISVIADVVSALGMMIAFYYGLTGFACAWFYRRTLGDNQRDLWMRGIIPALGGLMMFFALGWSLRDDWVYSDVTTSYTNWQMPFSPHWIIGGVFLIGIGTFLLGLVIMSILRVTMPAFFRGETLNAATPTMVPDVDQLPPSVDYA
jgi:amino acid transporter